VHVKLDINTEIKSGRGSKSKTIHNSNPKKAMADSIAETVPQNTPRRKIKPSIGSPVGSRKAPMKKPTPATSKSLDQQGDQVSEDMERETSGLGQDGGKAGVQDPEMAKGSASEVRDVGVENVGAGGDEGADESEDISEHEGAAEGAEGEEEAHEGDVVPVGKVGENGDIVNDKGDVIGKVAEGGSQPPSGSIVDEEGDVLDEEGNIIGKAKPLDDAAEVVDESKPNLAKAADKVDAGKLNLDDPSRIQEGGHLVGAAGNVIGNLEEGEQKGLAGKEAKNINAEGQRSDVSILEGKKVNKAGYIVDENGNPFGRLIEGNPKKLAGRTVDTKGNIWNDGGSIIGRAEPLPESERELAPYTTFEEFPNAVVEKSGKIMYEGRSVGILVEGDAKKLVGKKVDPDGDILDKFGNVLGKAERQDEEEPEETPPEKIDRSILAGKKVNKAGNVVDDSGAVFGHVVQGEIRFLVGKAVDEQGKIYNTVGKVIGQADPIPEDEREISAQAPFEDFPDSMVEKSGNVVCNGKVIGKVVEGDAKKLAGKKVDADGDIIDKNGNALGKAERWEEEEQVLEEVDKSILAGKRVNKAGNVVDSQGNIFGRLIEGYVKKLAGKMCDKNGFVRNEGGDIVGKAELIPESEREGMKEGPFADFPGCSLRKDGKVVDAQGVIVGKLTEGDPKKLYGKTVDEDGDIIDRNGNVLGKAERWEEEEEVKKDTNPMAGRKVNKEGNVTDENGDIIGKLTEGEISKCAGKTVDEDGDVVDSKSKVIGHATLLENIPEPAEQAAEEPAEEPQESPEEKEKREEHERDRKLAAQMATCIEVSLDKIKPVLKMITEVSKLLTPTLSHSFSYRGFCN
jgi:hypothetical protein